MDKQEATYFIVQALEDNRSQDEIVADLCQQLNAPPDLVGKFVSRVATQQQPMPASPRFADSQPQAAVQSRSPVMEITSVSPRPAAGQPASSRQQTPSSHPAKHADGAAQPSATQEELEKEILKALSKDRRHSDIVMEVCEQTSMSWDQAQRLVAQVATKNRKHLVSRQNMVIIPLAAIALLAGLALIAASVSEAQKLAWQLYRTPSEIPAQASEVEYILREGLWGFVIGLSLFLGGVYGLIRALQAQFD